MKKLIKNLLNKLANVKHDKLLHFIVGSYLVLVGILIFSPIVALLITAVIACSKEVVYDKLMKQGTPEIADFYATMYGALSTFLIYII